LNGFDDPHNQRPSFSSAQDRQTHVEEEGVNSDSGIVPVDEVEAHDVANQDSTDAMGALVFTNEDYSGFFGKYNEVAN